MKTLTIIFVLVATVFEAGCTTSPKVVTLKDISTPDTGFRLERVVQAVRQRYGDDAVAAAKDWNNALAVFKKESEQSRLKDVNDYVNHRIRLDTDINIWEKNDYWATPIESLIKGAGDCEDYAIAKYFSLKFSGMPVSRLRIFYVKVRIGGPDSNITKAHVVLAHYSTPDAEPLVLDNMISEIRPVSRRTDLAPIFSFNSEGVWAAQDDKPQSGDASRLSKWAYVIEKMKEEGFE